MEALKKIRITKSKAQFELDIAEEEKVISMCNTKKSRDSLVKYFFNYQNHKRLMKVLSIGKVSTEMQELAITHNHWAVRHALCDYADNEILKRLIDDKDEDVSRHAISVANRRAKEKKHDLEYRIKREIRGSGIHVCRTHSYHKFLIERVYHNGDKTVYEKLAVRDNVRDAYLCAYNLYCALSENKKLTPEPQAQKKTSYDRAVEQIDFIREASNNYVGRYTLARLLGISEHTLKTIYKNFKLKEMGNSVTKSMLNKRRKFLRENAK